MSLITINVYNDAKLDKILLKLNQMESIIMSTQEEITQLTTQATKIFTEVTNLKATLEASIADLEAQIAAGNTLDLSALKAAIQSIDDIVPDAAPAPGA